jgi:hypothetical protein
MFHPIFINEVQVTGGTITADVGEVLLSISKSYSGVEEITYVNLG